MGPGALRRGGATLLAGGLLVAVVVVVPRVPWWAGRSPPGRDSSWARVVGLRGAHDPSPPWRSAISRRPGASPGPGLGSATTRPRPRSARTVRVSSHDIGGLSQRDVDLARRITDAARELDIPIGAEG